MTAYFVYIACPVGDNSYTDWDVCDIIDEPDQDDEQNKQEAFLTARKLREFYHGHLVAVRKEGTGMPLPLQQLA
jgi:hypothetical protein